MKIDGSLVGNLTSRPLTRIFLRHLLGLIKALGLATVAECVENGEDAALLRADGITYLQGHHFGRPTIGRIYRSGPAVPGARDAPDLGPRNLRFAAIPSQGL